MGLKRRLSALLVGELVLNGHAQTDDESYNVRAEGVAPRQRTLAAAFRVVELKGTQTDDVLKRMERGFTRLLGSGVWSVLVSGLVEVGVLAPPKWWFSPHFRLVEAERLEAIVTGLQRAAAGDDPLEPRTALLLRMIPPSLVPAVAPGRRARKHAGLRSHQAHP